MFDEEALERAEKRGHGAAPGNSAPPGGPPPAAYSIAGNSSGWHRLPMRWDGGRFVHEVTIGSEGYESFQVLLNGSWDTVFYPSIQDGSPWAKCTLRGPDTQGHGRNWTIGRPTEKRLWRNLAAPGERYLILVAVDAGGAATSVTWRRLEAGEAGSEHAALAADLGSGPGGPGEPRDATAALGGWSPPASAQAGATQGSSRARAGGGLWLASESRGDMELGDIVLPRPGDVISGGRGLASRGGEVVRIDFVETSRLEEWREAAFSQVAPAPAAAGREASSEAAVGGAAGQTAEGHPRSSVAEGGLSVVVWRVPDVRGWGHVPAIKLKEPDSFMRVCLDHGKTVGDLREAVRAGLPFSAALWNEECHDLADDSRPLEPLVREGARLFYDFYHDVRVYRGGGGSLQRFFKVTVKASATLYDVRAAVVRMVWHMYCDLQFVEEGEDGSWRPLGWDEPLEGRTELLAVGAFMDELPAFEVDEEADLALWDGPHAGKRVRCRVEGTSDSGETYDLHILPTAEYDGAGGRSDTYVPRIPNHLLRKAKSNAGADKGPRARPAMRREQALELLRELLAGYKSEDFQQRVEDLMAHHPDRTGFIAEVKYYTGFYTMRKQVLLSLQSVVLPKYGFSKYQGGTVMMVTAIKQFSGDAEIDGLGYEINTILQPMYEEKLT